MTSTAGKAQRQPVHEAFVIFDRDKPRRRHAAREDGTGDDPGAWSQFQHRPGPRHIDLARHRRRQRIAGRQYRADMAGPRDEGAQEPQSVGESARGHIPN